MPLDSWTDSKLFPVCCLRLAAIVGQRRRSPGTSAAELLLPRCSADNLIQFLFEQPLKLCYILGQMPPGYLSTGSRVLRLVGDKSVKWMVPRNT